MKRWSYLVPLIIVVVVLTGCVGGGTVFPTYGNLRGVVGIPGNRLSTLSLGTEPLDPSDIVITADVLPRDYVPLVGAKIYLGNSQYALTNYNGEFNALNIPVGRYTLTIDHDWIRPLKKTVYIQRGENGFTEYLAGRAFYIVIGIERYPYLPKAPSIPGPYEDAMAVYNSLFLNDNEMAGLGARLLNSSATKANIRSAISNAGAAAASAEDYLVLYFSGLSGQDFLRPYDDDNSSWSTSVTDRDLELWFRDFPGNVTVIIDGAESESMADGRLAPLALKQPKYTVISAAHTGESVNYDPNFRNSVFTYFLVEGLRSRHADSNQDKMITAQELYDYVYIQMRGYYHGFSDYDSHMPTIHRGGYGDAVIFRY